MTEENLQNLLVNLTRELMIIQSDELHPENKRRCLQIARFLLESVPEIDLKDFDDEGHPSLIALPKGSAKPEVLMVVHLDVVTHEAGDFPDPKIENNRIIGPGAGDMKGIVAVCLKVFEDLHRAHPGISLGLAITTDEETGGHHGAKALIEQRGLSAGVVLVPDGGGPNELSVAEKGILHLSLKAVGQETHAAAPWHGVNAVERLMDDCRKIKEWVEGLESDYEDWIPTGTISGLHTPNRSVNIVPAHAEAMMDIRFPPPNKSDDVLSSIRSMLSHGVSITTSVTDDPSELNPDPVYESCMTGDAVQHVRNQGGSDARFFARKGIPVNMSRPLVGSIHADDEWIDIPSMLEFYDMYRRYIEKTCCK